MHESSWLGYSWDLADSARSSAGVQAPGGAAGDGRAKARIASRRDRFRLDVGPSREQLQWLQIASILLKIRCPPSPPSSFPARIVPQQQQHQHLGSTHSLRISSSDQEAKKSSTSQDEKNYPNSLRVSCSGQETKSSSAPQDKQNGTGSQVGCLETIAAISSSLGQDGRQFCDVGLKELLQVVSWPIAAVGDMASIDPFEIQWQKVPESADPMRGSGYRSQNEEEGNSGHGEGFFSVMGRGERKRVQVENIASVLSSFQLPAGSRVVDFGCGSGALTLPLAAVFSQLTFIGVDFKQQSVALLQGRARRAGLGNVVAVHERIEEFCEPFDACVALHACGIATDLALLQALKHRAAYVVSPCCIGKLQIPIEKLLLNSAQHMQSRRNPGSVTNAVATTETPVNRSSSHRNSVQFSRSVGSNELFMGGLEPNSVKSSQNSLALHEAGRLIERSSLRDIGNSVIVSLVYPRSRWLRSSISENDFQVLARAADWSSYDHDSSASRLHSLCKAVLEIDRNEASRECGYWTGLFCLSNEKAGTVGVSHVLMGYPLTNCVPSRSL